MSKLSNIVDKLKDWACIAAVSAIPLGMMGTCGYLVYTGVTPEPELHVPTEKQNKHWGVAIHTYSVISGSGMPTRDLYIKDLDKDGTADGIFFANRTYWIAKEHLKGYPDAWVMGPEMRNAATDAMQSHQRLRYMLAHDEYRHLKKGLKK